MKGYGNSDVLEILLVPDCNIRLNNFLRSENILFYYKGLGSQTGFFGPVIFTKSQNHLQSYKLFFSFI